MNTLTQPTATGAGGFLGQNWSMSHLGDKLKGLTNQDGFNSLNENPLFNVGMGLLSSNYDGSNPYKAVMGGLSNARTAGNTQKDRERIEELRKELAHLIAQQSMGSTEQLVPDANQLLNQPSQVTPSQGMGQPAGGPIGSAALNPAGTPGVLGANSETARLLRANRMRLG